MKQTMTVKCFITSIILIHVIFIGYGQADLYEGSRCRIHTGERGVCKNINECHSVKDGIEHHTLRFDDIVICSFVGSTQIVCCSDERPLPHHHRHTTRRPNTNTDFVFAGHRPISTTTTTQRTTTVNSFWTDWSATQPTNLDENDTDLQTTTKMPAWMENALNEDETTTKKNAEISMPPWLQNVLNEHAKTTTTTTTTTNMPSWIQNVLDEDPTTNKPSTTGVGSHNSGAGSNLDSDSNDNRFPHRNRSTRKPPSSVNSRFRKADEACQTYTQLPTVSELSWHILNGVPTTLGEFPWMAAIGYNSVQNPGEIEFNCGGTIISEYYVLTAAHCDSSKNKATMVRLGKVTLLTNDDDAEPLDLNIEQFIKHPDYSTLKKINDIALIRVENEIKFTEYIRPACLHTNTNDVSEDVRLIITGWGTTSALKTQRPEVLLQTNVTAVPLSSCNHTLFEFNRAPNLPSLRNGLNPGQTCAYDPKAASDACQGDSGGPLQMFGKSSAISTIVGVVSFGVSCGTALPGVYTRVAFYVGWIESIVWPT